MKKKTLRAVVVPMVSLFLLVFFVSCSKKSLVDVKPVKKGKVGEEFLVQKSADKTPKWLDDPEFQVIKEKRQKFIVVSADISNYKDKRAAERIAEGELRKKVAEGIKTLVESQFREAMTGSTGSYSETFESYVETVARDIPVVGLVVTDTYWEKIQRIKSENEVEYVYRVVRRGRMPYENYANARDNAWEQVRARLATEEERQQLEKLLEAMNQGDEQ